MARNSVPPLKLITAATAVTSIGVSDTALIDGSKDNDGKEVTLSYPLSLVLRGETLFDSGGVSMTTGSSMSMVTSSDNGADGVVNCRVSLKKDPPTLIQKAACSPDKNF